MSYICTHRTKLEHCARLWGKEFIKGTHRPHKLTKHFLLSWASLSTIKPFKKISTQISCIGDSGPFNLSRRPGLVEMSLPTAAGLKRDDL